MSPQHATVGIFFCQYVIPHSSLYQKHQKSNFDNLHLFFDFTLYSGSTSATKWSSPFS